MNEEALVRLRQIVLEAPETLWDMSHFSTSKKCGTAYCAAGWAAQDQWFKERNLSLDNYSSNTNFFSRLEKLFDLNERDCGNLFGGDLQPGDEVSKEEVIANIDQLLDGKPTLVYRRSINL
jgi:hypothetical protein